MSRLESRASEGLTRKRAPISPSSRKNGVPPATPPPFAVYDVVVTVATIGRSCARKSLERRTVCSSGGAFLDALDRFAIEDGRVSSHVEQVLARAAVTSAGALFLREVSEAMLDDHTLA